MDQNAEAKQAYRAEFQEATRAYRAQLLDAKQAVQREVKILVRQAAAAQKAEVNRANGLYAQSDILARGKFSKSHLYNLINRGHFPAPSVVIGTRFTRWSAADCDAWFADPVGWINDHAPAKAAA